MTTTMFMDILSKKLKGNNVIYMESMLDTHPHQIHPSKPIRKSGSHILII
jgi:hypothetical protein